MREPPPARFTGEVATTVLTAGTVLARVHQTVYGPVDYNPVGSDVLFGGGRFDSTAEDPYGFLYGAATDRAALAEALLRDVPADDRGARFLAKKYWRGRGLSRFEVTRSLTLVSLVSGEDLGAIGQDTWLTTCDPGDYPQTRAWAHWLRRRREDAAGLVWLSKRQPGVRSFCLFGDRCPPGALVPAAGPLPGPCAFEAEDGFAWLRENLAGFRVAIRR
ncbi:MAG TPA: RES family NAD+ phosphorylase [Solirubrobacterales bacterium]|nr:RES family NAD+ phosphorylase [Solirubrobacterales bacterium]